MSGSNLLITSEVEADNTVISVGDYLFHMKSKVVMRKRMKRSEGAILWTPQGDKPEQRAMQSASTLGAFAAMNLGAANDSRREIESLRVQVSMLQESLQKTMTECIAMAARAEREQDRRKALASEKEELERQVKDLQSNLETSKLSRSDAQLFLQEATSTNDKGMNIRKSFFSLVVGTIQEMHQNLSLNEKVLNQQKEELHTMMEVRRKVSEYQKKTQADQVRRFSLMQLK